MKTKNIIILAVLLAFVSIKANAFPIPIIYSDGTTFTKVYEFPQTEDFEFKNKYGNMVHFDLGVEHEEFSLFGIPLWNYGNYKYAIFNDEGDSYSYTELGKDDIATLQEIYSDIPDEPELPFWNTVGGKLVAIAILIVLIGISKGIKDSKEEDSKEKETAENDRESGE